VQVESLLVAKQVGIVQRGLIHELQRLCDQEHGQDDEIELPSHAPGLQTCEYKVRLLLIFLPLLAGSKGRFYLSIGEFQVTRFEVLLVADRVLLQR
jgi:hypothetical protein